MPDATSPLIPGGYVKSFRKELCSEIWDMPPIYHRVWYWIRLNVQYETYLFPTPGKFGIWVLPGQRITSLRQIAEGVSWKEWGVVKIPNSKTIKAILGWLENQEMVTVESNTKGTLISVVNWNSYNGSTVEKVTAESNTVRIANGTQSGSPMEYGPDTSKKEEEGRRKKRISNNLKPPPSPESLRLSGLLADFILQNNPGNTQLINGRRDSTVIRWSKDIDKLIQVDSRSVLEIEQVIRWSQADDFWRGNILSGASLKRKWNSLAVKMKGRERSRGGSFGKLSPAIRGKGDFAGDFPDRSDEW